MASMNARRSVPSLFVATLLAGAVQAQGTSGPRVSDSSVGYIDSAIPGDVFRFRFDAAYDDRRPTRAEFFYPKGGPAGPGLQEPETSVDFQELSAYLEMAASDSLSAFVDLLVRFINPQVNADHAGFADLDAGFKFAFIRSEDWVSTFQFRTYAPTGDSHQGLGTNHVTLEPAFLSYNRLTDRLGLESELRLWTPVGGTDFAGEIVRYGIGLHYDLFRTSHCTFIPVAEFVGWTLLDGKETVVSPSGTASIHEAGGETIVNAKLGLSIKLGESADVYAGYGTPLTGDRWYDNTFRVQFRLFY
jgi:hypothetical protein